MDASKATSLILAEVEGDPAKPLAAIMSEIEDIRQGALARDENEQTEGVCAIGFGLKDEDGDIYAISTPVRSTRYPRVKDRLTETMLRNLSDLSF